MEEPVEYIKRVRANFISLHNKDKKHFTADEEKRVLPEKRHASETFIDLCKCVERYG